MYNLLENTLRKIIREELNESVSDKVYHFTDPSSMLNILKNNEILLTPSYGISSDSALNYNKLYSFSMTTSPNSSIGYNGDSNPTYLTRIEMNGRELNYNYKSKHVDYWRSSRDPKKYNTLYDISRANEMEERLLTNKDRIIPASRYITKIDVIIRYSKYGDVYRQIKQLADEYGIPCYLYNDAKSFNHSIIKNSIELPEINPDLETDTYDSKRLDYYAIEILALVAYKDNKLKQSIISELENFNVENAQEKINAKISDMKSNYFQYGLDPYQITQLSRIIETDITNNRSTTDELTRYAIRILGYNMRKAKCRTIKEYITYKINIGKKTQEQYNKQFYNAMIKLIDDEYQKGLNELNKYSFYTIQGDYREGNITKELPEVKANLDKMINSIKEYIKKYILNNDDMFRYSYVLSKNEIIETLDLNNINYDFASGIIDKKPIKDTIYRVLYLIDAFYYDYILKMQDENSKQWSYNE